MGQSVLPDIVAILVGLAAIATAAWVGRSAKQRRAIVERMGASVPAAELGAHEGKRVVLAGVLDGGDVTTRFGPAIRSILDVHPEASSSRPASLAIRSGDARVELIGPVQAVMGTTEERSTLEAGPTSVRRVSERSSVLVTGTVVRSDEGYREARFAIAARGDGTWIERPIGLFAAKKSRAMGVLGAIGVLSLAGGLADGYWRTPSIGVPNLDNPPELPLTCGEAIVARLNHNDIFGAEAALAGCDDLRARAETLWSLGRVDDAATAFIDARAKTPAMPMTLSEVEAVIVARPKEQANEWLARLQRDWYRGLPDPSQRSVECLSGAKTGDWRPCLRESNVELTFVPSAYGNPVTVVSDTFAFARDLPRHPMRARTWDEDYGDRCTTVGCRATRSASLALFAGLAADGPRAAREFAVLDKLVDEFDAAEQTHLGEYGITTNALLAQGGFAVAAVAAWYVHDDAHVERYLKRSEAHVRDTLGQHLELGRVGGKKSPVGDSSKWSSVDQELHGLADREAPEDFVRRLKDLSYSNPLRLHALLGARPRVSAAARPWVEGEFVRVCRTCGVFAMLEGTAKRREAARLVGAKDLEAKLAEVSRRFGEAWMRDASRKTLWSIESLYAPEP